MHCLKYKSSFKFEIKHILHKVIEFYIFFSSHKNQNELSYSKINIRRVNYNLDYGISNCYSGKDSIFF